MTEENRVNIMEQTSANVPAEKNAEPETKVEYASILERFIALLIDYGVIFIPMQLVARVALKMLPASHIVENLIMVIIGINVIFILYEAIFSCGDRVSLGKALVGIAVMKEDTSGPISFGKSFLRAIGYYISAGLLGCGFLWAFVDDHHRALHDMLCKSVVVRVRRKTSAEKVLIHVVGVILLFGLGYVLYSNVWGGTAWREKIKVRQAEEFLLDIGLLEDAHKRLYGSYTTDFLRLVLLSGDPVQFQRDMNKVLSNKGFRIGVKENHYKIMARAKDEKATPVVYEKKH